MSAKRVLKDFVISPLFPTVMILVFSLVVFVINNLLSPQNPISATVYIVVMVALIFWLVLRFWLGERLKLIEEYKSWMTPLRIVTKRPSIIRQLMHTDMGKTFHPCCLDYYRYKTVDLGNRFEDLEAKLVKLSNPYRLSEYQINSITQDIVKFIRDYKSMFKEFEYKIYTEKIPLNNLDDCSNIDRANGDLITASTNRRINSLK